MGLRCSLIGHDFGEPQVERERQERGSEVVVTVREYEECSRCGEKHITSESTEVTTLSTEAGRPPEEPAEAAGVVDDGTDGSDPADDAELIEDDAELIEDDAELIEDDAELVETETEAIEDAGGIEAADRDDGGVGTADGAPEVPVDGTGEPVTDDAEILEGTEASGVDRQHGEWPDSSDVGPPAGAEKQPPAWPESSDPEAATPADSGVEASSDVPVDEEAGEPTPEEDPIETGTGIASAQSVPAPGAGGRRDDVVAEFFCPNCGFVAPGDRGSLRAGDICPECRKGYLGERELAPAERRRGTRESDEKR